MLADGERFTLLAMPSLAGLHAAHRPHGEVAPVKTESEAIRELTDAVYHNAWLGGEQAPARVNRHARRHLLAKFKRDGLAGVTALVSDAQLRPNSGGAPEGARSVEDLATAYGFGDLAEAYALVGVGRAATARRSTRPLPMRSARFCELWDLCEVSERAGASANGWVRWIDLAGNGECRCLRPVWRTFCDAMPASYRNRATSRGEGVTFEPTGFERLLQVGLSCNRCRACLLARSLRLRARAVVEEASCKAVRALTLTFPPAFQELHKAYVRLYGQQSGWDFDQLPKRDQLRLMQAAVTPVLERLFTYMRDAIDCKEIDPNWALPDWDDEIVVWREVQRVGPLTRAESAGYKSWPRQRLCRRDRLRGDRMSLRYCRTSEFGGKGGQYHVHMLLFYQHSAHRILTGREVKALWRKSLRVDLFEAELGYSIHMEDPEYRGPMFGQTAADFAKYFTKYTCKGSGEELAVARICMSEHFGSREHGLARMRAAGVTDNDIVKGQTLLAQALARDQSKTEFRARNGLDERYKPVVERAPAATPVKRAYRIEDRIAMRRNADAVLPHPRC